MEISHFCHPQVIITADFATSVLTSLASHGGCSLVNVLQLGEITVYESEVFLYVDYG